MICEYQELTRLRLRLRLQLVREQRVCRNELLKYTNRSNMSCRRAVSVWNRKHVHLLWPLGSRNKFRNLRLGCIAQ